MVMKTQTCRLCQASYVPQETEGYCSACMLPGLKQKRKTRGPTVRYSIDYENLNKYKEEKQNGKRNQ